MKEKITPSIKEIWKRANEITVEQLVEAVPAGTVGKCAAVVLAVLAVLPVFVSGTFRLSDQYPVIDENAIVIGGGASYAYSMGDYWIRCLAILGCVAGLLGLFQMTKAYYQGKRATCARRRWVLDNLLPLCLLMLLLWSILSAAVSGNPLDGFLGTNYRQEGVLTYLLYAAVFCTALLPVKRQRRVVCEVLAAVGAVTGLLVIIGENEIFYLEDDLRAAMFHQYNHYGYFLAVCLPLCVGLILQDEKPSLPLRLVRLAEFWLLCNAVAFNSVRGSFLGIAFVMVVWNVLILWKHRGRWKRLAVLDLIFMATILFLNTGSSLLERLGVLTQQIEQVQQGSSEEVLDEIGSDRGILWRLGIQFALEKPLFGYGPENLRDVYKSYRLDLSDRPHNELIQIAASLGLPALAFYLTGLGSLLASFFRNLKKMSIFELACFSSVGGYLVSSLFGNTMYYTTPYFYMMLAFAWRAGKGDRT